MEITFNSCHLEIKYLPLYLLLPGWGSAWTNPVWNICSAKASMSFLSTSHRLRPAFLMLSTSLTLYPDIYSAVRTLWKDNALSHSSKLSVTIVFDVNPPDGSATSEKCYGRKSITTIKLFLKRWVRKKLSISNCATSQSKIWLLLKKKKLPRTWW